MLKNDHICVDIETLSTNTNAVIVSIGAVRFSFDTDEVEKFSVNINPQSSKELGLHISQDTLNFWKKQNPAAISAWKDSPVSLKEALDSFDEFLGDTKYTQMYANGIAFDYSILQSSYFAIGRKEPWKYYNLMDMRTIFKIAKLDFMNYPRVGNNHSAIDDCLTQIKALKECAS